MASYRSRQTLERWVAEFVQARGAGEPIYVILQDPEDGGDDGLVVVPFTHSTTSVFMQPAAIGAAEWRITIEPQPDVSVWTSFQVNAFATELLVAAELCSFLEARSVGHIEDDEDPSTT